MPNERVDGPLTVSVRGSGIDLVIPAEELRWRFSRSGGPGGQGVNTTDSRVELSWAPGSSAVLSGLGDEVRSRVLSRLVRVLVRGEVVVTASEHRAQLRNRDAARDRLAHVVGDALAPPVRRRRPTRPTRGSIERRLQAKQARSRTKQQRRRPQD